MTQLINDKKESSATIILNINVMISYLTMHFLTVTWSKVPYYVQCFTFVWCENPHMTLTFGSSYVKKNMFVKAY